jgi:hypothetical protein
MLLVQRRAAMQGKRQLLSLRWPQPRLRGIIRSVVCLVRTSPKVQDCQNLVYARSKYIPLEKSHVASSFRDIARHLLAWLSCMTDAPKLKMASRSRLHIQVPDFVKPYITKVPMLRFINRKTSKPCKTKEKAKYPLEGVTNINYLPLISVPCPIIPTYHHQTSNS